MLSTRPGFSTPAKFSDLHDPLANYGLQLQGRRMGPICVGGQWESPSGGHLAGSYLDAGGHSAFPDGSSFLIGPGGS
ncbi:hypothetical protein GCM10010449_05460 [Streptomyces rectiviolaceus]|uniref:Uncharacterized protein n=1 Tax=Streptomyces rectiviolaceus TaxID=332591 RepID=A0ABP6M705_9ACTN